MFYLVFVFGVIVGSFLNVVIYRLKICPTTGGAARNAIFGRSFCPECQVTLKWRDLVPIFSFLWLKGQCRYCRKKISWQYPTVEILSGLIWIGVFWKVFGNWNLGFVWNLEFGIWNFIYYIFIFSTLLIIAVYDFKWKIIPDKIIYPAIAVVFLYNIFNSFKLLNFETFKLLNFEIFKYLNIEIFIWSLLTAIIAFLFFFAIYFFSSGRAMGLGDAKLAFLIGLFLNPFSAIAAFTLAFIIGALFGIILLGLSKISHPLVYKKWVMKSQIAFGPFLVLGTALAFLVS